MPHILQEFRQAFGNIVSKFTFSKKAYLLGFYGYAAAHKSLVTKSNHGSRLRCRKALRNWSINEWKQVLRSDESIFHLYQSNGRV
ncbi:transposable element tcb1 transposase [Trichonephila clavipes]|nr:transposable element tcb1 transposase [Trichonephila clavipes]